MVRSSISGEVLYFHNISADLEDKNVLEFIICGQSSKISATVYTAGATNQAYYYYIQTMYVL
jgi:hypothetical protein